MLAVTVGGALAGTLASAGRIAGAATDPRSERPRAGDVLVHRFGDRAGTPVEALAVPRGDELVAAVPMDPGTGVVRDGSRLNAVNVVRMDPALLSEETARRAGPRGTVAYSSVCTHQGCDLTQFLGGIRHFKCYCHYSEFDAADFGTPVRGPARRRLPLLPLDPDSEVLTVAAPFTGRPGFKRKRRR